MAVEAKINLTMKPHEFDFMREMLEESMVHYQTIQNDRSRPAPERAAAREKHSRIALFLEKL
jgi:hypothetical protein